MRERHGGGTQARGGLGVGPAVAANSEAKGVMKIAAGFAAAFMIIPFGAHATVESYAAIVAARASPS